MNTHAVLSDAWDIWVKEIDDKEWQRLSALVSAYIPAKTPSVKQVPPNAMVKREIRSPYQA